MKDPSLTVLVIGEIVPAREQVVARLTEGSTIRAVASPLDGSKVAQLAAELLPQVAMILMNRPGAEIFPVRQLRAVSPNTNILALIPSPDDTFLMSPVMLLLSGCLLDSASSTELRKATREADSGRRVLSKGIERQLMRSVLAKLGRRRSGASAKLSSRQAEVLEQMALGLRNGEIAELLGLSTRTVEAHVQWIFEKLAATNRTEAIAIAVRRGLISAAGPSPSGPDRGSPLRGTL